MAGLTLTGLTIKRLPEVLATLQETAQDLWADQVEPGDTVDVSEDSALGRMIAVVAPSQAIIWEQIQAVYDAFNPNTATGISLENLVALSAINRLPAQPTRAQVILEGDRNAIVGTSAQFTSRTTKINYNLVTAAVLSTDFAVGIGMVVSQIQNNTAYTVGYSTDGGVNYINATYTSDGSATDAKIRAGVLAALKSTFGALFDSVDDGTYLWTTRKDLFQSALFRVSANMQILKVRKMAVAQATENGPLTEEAYGINTITVPVSGLNSVYNPIAATPGRYLETDVQLRARFEEAKFTKAVNQLEAMIDALKAVDGVTDVIVYENDTSAEDIYGVPANSFMPIVLGGLPSAVANAIWQNKPLGIPSFGNTTVPVIDSQGLPHDIRYKTPTKVPIYINVNITDTGGLPGDAVAQVTQNILNYTDGVYEIGDDVIYSRFYTPVNAVPGHQVNSLTIGKAANPTGTSNIPIAFDEVADFSAARINVTIS